MNYRVLTILLLALTVRLGWLAAFGNMPVEPGSDAGFNHALAVQIARGGGYTLLDSDVPTAFLPPLYPALLGIIFRIFGISILNAQLFNVVVQVLLVIGIFYLTLHLFDQRAATIAAIIIALYPEFIGFNALIMPELLVAMLIIWAFVAAINPIAPRLVISGMLFGLAVLARATSIMMPLILFSSLWLMHKTIGRQAARSFLVVCIVAIVTVLPYIARNYAVFGRFIFISDNSGAVFYNGNNPIADGTYAWNSDLQATLDNTSELTMVDSAQARAINWIKTNPERFRELIPKKLRYLWGDEIYTAVNYILLTNYDMQWYLELTGNSYKILVITAAIGTIFSKRKAVLILMLFLFTSLLAIIFQGDMRYHFYMIPIFAMYSGFAISCVARLWRKTTRIYQYRQTVL